MQLIFLYKEDDDDGWSLTWCSSEFDADYLTETSYEEITDFVGFPKDLPGGTLLGAEFSIESSYDPYPYHCEMDTWVDLGNVVWAKPNNLMAKLRLLKLYVKHCIKKWKAITGTKTKCIPISTLYIEL